MTSSGNGPRGTEDKASSERKRKQRAREEDGREHEQRGGAKARKIEWCVCHAVHRVPGWCFCDMEGEDQRRFLREKRRVAGEEEERKRQKRQRQGFGGGGAWTTTQTNRGFEISFDLRQGRWTRRRGMSPRTPAATTQEHSPPRCGSATLSSLFAGGLPCADLDGPEARRGSPPRPRVRRNLQDDFERSLLALPAVSWGSDNSAAGEEESSTSAADDDAESASSSSSSEEEVRIRIGRSGAAMQALTENLCFPGNQGSDASCASKGRRAVDFRTEMPWHYWRCRGCGKKLPDGHVNCVGEVLRRFDLCSKFGPCLGITRHDRWLRAFGLGLDPPRAVLDILEETLHPEVVHVGVWDQQQ
ncbi:hypothetical protein HOP50_13g68020 [Chloropicon primus]|uniref:Uncharacterized protein n=1 Tax=Chloropicon primus TaxID=1764295 RepID=A0A5B8MVI6_9CHLO|nr:hypothetical protein A3770_13p67840 [Chloropicon primus]UPR03473.1 hypothetical protein HOP50_13g68020 [Chloropicon primus]|eukprot:QDZ24266.1 hypothetical protein A3770_13p67840 [Chloropicon primus]